MPDGNTSIDAERPRRESVLMRLSRLFNPEKSETETVSAEENEAQDNTSPANREMRLRISEFESLRVRDVMIPRVEISAVDVEMTLEELLKYFSENSHSRLPVFRSTLDDPLGFVHLKDVVTEISSNGSLREHLEDRPLSRLKREILFVPASMRLPGLLLKMQTSRIHLALVVDEYGGTDGLVSLEDLVEQIVGDIEDEHDEDDEAILSRGRHVWEADAKTQIDDFEAETGLELSLEDFEDEIDTLGGLAFALAGRVPQRGEIIRHPSGVEIEILDADPRRIKRLRVRGRTNQKTLSELEIEEQDKVEDAGEEITRNQ